MAYRCVSKTHAARIEGSTPPGGTKLLWRNGIRCRLKHDSARVQVRVLLGAQMEDCESGLFGSLARGCVAIHTGSNPVSSANVEMDDGVKSSV